ncbi:MAG TPA: hypothetical protein VJS14_13205, partial [Enterobacteriaceae bacterium]|nr:hypothetical protein [Enterobacteriaceae bacterium]
MAGGDGATSGVTARADEILVASKDTAINKRAFNSISSVIHSASFVRKQIFLSQGKLKADVTARAGKGALLFWSRAESFTIGAIDRT